MEKQKKYFFTPTCTSVYQSGKYLFEFRPVCRTGAGYGGVLVVQDAPELEAIKPLVERGAIDEITEVEYNNLIERGQFFRVAGEIEGNPEYMQKIHRDRSQDSEEDDVNDGPVIDIEVEEILKPKQVEAPQAPMASPKPKQSARKTKSATR